MDALEVRDMVVSGCDGDNVHDMVVERLSVTVADPDDVRDSDGSTVALRGDALKERVLDC